MAGCCGSCLARKWHFITAVAALVGIAPWLIYLGGLAKLTDVLMEDGKVISQALRQPIIMLEWYTVAAQIVYILLIAILGFASSLRKSHVFLVGWIMCNTAIIVMRATERIQQINQIDDGALPSTVLNVPKYTGKPLPYLRAEAAGQVATCCWNFFLAILLNVAGDELVHNKAVGTVPPVAA